MTWPERAREVVRGLAASGRSFSTDSVWDLMVGDPPPEPRALGVVMRELARAREIEPTGAWWTSTRRASNGRSVRVWRAGPALARTGATR